MMREIVAAVEDEMQIASPSKVFAGIGAYMAQGLGEGFGREMRGVEKSIRKATDNAVPDNERSAPAQGRQTGNTFRGGAKHLRERNLLRPATARGGAAV